MPISRYSSRSRTIRYEELRAALIRGQPPRDALVLDADGETYAYSRRSFENPQALDIFFVQLRSRIGRNPRRPQIMAGLRHGEKTAFRLSRVRPVATYAFLISVLVGYLIQLALGGSHDLLINARIGANLGHRTLSGEWYRAFTANFLHAGILHLYLNGLSLFSLGSAVEKLMGVWSFVLVFLVSAVCGALTSAWFHPYAISVGVSTAVFGVLGAFGVLHLLYRGAVPLGFRQTRRWWIFVLGISALLPILVPVIDIGAHVGGFLSGALTAVAIMFLRRNSTSPPGPQSLPIIRYAALAMLGAYGVAISQAAWAAATHSPAREAAIEQHLLGGQVRRFADRICAHPEDDLVLQFAQVLAASASKLEPVWLGDTGRELRVESVGRQAWLLDGDFRKASTVWMLGWSGVAPVALIRADQPRVSRQLVVDLSRLQPLTRLSVHVLDFRDCSARKTSSGVTVWPLASAEP